MDRTQGEATTPLLRWEGTSSSINRFSGGTYRIHEEEIHRIFEAVNTVITLGGEEEVEEEEEEEGLFKANAVNEEEEEGLFKADAVNEEDSERDRATQV